MAKTSIEWTEYTWNPVTGCSVVSPGCTNCYAMKLAGTRLRNHPSRQGLTVASRAGPVWNGKVRLNTEWLDQPLRWTKPRRIFVCAHGDLFHESVPDAWIDQVFAVMALAPQHTFQVLTKRAARMREYLTGRWQPRLIPHLQRWQKRPAGHGVLLETRNGVLPNVWLGVSAEDQPRADERVPELLATPAAVRFVSYEPALGPVEFRDLDINGEGTMDALKRRTWGQEIAEGWRDTSDTWEEDFLDWFSLRQMPDPEEAMHPTLDWVICGGENGPGARPMHPDWARQVRDDCAEAGVPFFFKQWGTWAPICTMSEAQVDACYHPRPRRDPEASRRPKVASTVLHRDGGRHNHLEPMAFAPGAMTCMAIGKTAAGRLLDGVAHDALPEITTTTKGASR